MHEQNNIQEEQQQANQRILIGILLVSVLLILGLLLLWQLMAPRSNPLFRGQASATAVPLQFDGQPQLVNFETLDEDAPAYQDRRIQITGQYFPLTLPDCSPFNGPPFQWALVGAQKQVNAIGFEGVVPLLAADTTMTVEGIWRWYAGPVGCGKEPPGAPGIWYLQVEQIIAPNPIRTADNDEGAALTPTTQTTVPITTDLSPTPTASFVTPLPTATQTEVTVTIAAYPPPADGTPTELTATPPPAPTATENSGGYPAATATPDSSLPPITPTATTSVTRPASTPATATMTPTPSPTNSAGTVTSTPTPGATLPPVSTATPGSGYPIVTPTVGSGYP